MENKVRDRNERDIGDGRDGSWLQLELVRKGKEEKKILSPLRTSRVTGCKGKKEREGQ